jgi:hypothetical protein
MFMDWIRESWFFILFFILFIWMHFSGHGCSGHDHGSDELRKKEGRAVCSEKNRSEKKDR